MEITEAQAIFELLPPRYFGDPFKPKEATGLPSFASVGSFSNINLTLAYDTGIMISDPVEEYRRQRLAWQLVSEMRLVAAMRPPDWRSVMAYVSVG